MRMKFNSLFSLFHGNSFCDRLGGGLGRKGKNLGLLKNLHLFNELFTENKPEKAYRLTGALLLIDFSAIGFPLRLEMAQVLFTSVFYLLLLVVLGLMAFYVRLLSYGATRILEPDTRTLPKQEK